MATCVVHWVRLSRGQVNCLVVRRQLGCSKWPLSTHVREVQQGGGGVGAWPREEGGGDAKGVSFHHGSGQEGSEEELASVKNKAQWGPLLYDSWINEELEFQELQLLGGF